MDIPGCPKLYQPLVPGPSSPKKIGDISTWSNYIVARTPRIYWDIPGSVNHLSQAQVVPKTPRISWDIPGCPKLCKSIFPGPKTGQTTDNRPVGRISRKGVRYGALPNRGVKC